MKRKKDSPGIPPTGANFALMLKSKLTQYDMKTSAREAKRGRSNIYRLGHLLEAASRVEAEMGTCATVTAEATPECLSQMRAALCRNFTCDPITGKPDLPPVREAAKQIDEFLATGKKPSLVR